MPSSCAGYKFVIAKLILLFLLFGQSVNSDLLYDRGDHLTESLPLSYYDEIHQIDNGYIDTHDLPTNLSAACRDAIKDLTLPERLFLKYASGKDIRDWGHYEECVRPDNYTYCMVLFRVDYANDKTKDNVTAQEEIGTCLPKQCSETDVVLLGEQKANNISKKLWDLGLHVNFTKIYPSCAQSESYGAGGIIMFTIISILLLLLLVGTGLDFYQRYEDRIKAAVIQRNYFEMREVREEKIIVDDDLDAKPLVINDLIEEPPEVSKKSSEVVLDRSWRGFLLCWSAIYNVEKLLVATPGSLVCLNGLRTISMFAIILGHNYAFLNLEALDDLQTLLDDSKNHILFQVIPGAFFAVDTFFFISGLLVTYLSLQELQKKGKLNLILFYFHRFWRLTPVLAILVFIYWFIVPYVSSGPWWNLETSAIATTCNEYWWSTLLYIQNFIPTSMTGECMGWTWYLANDTQFYIFTPIVLYAFYYNRWVGWSLLTGLILACLAVNIFLVIYYDFTYYFAYYFLNNNQDFFNYLYIKPYARAFPWLVGIGLGFIFVQSGFKFRIGTVTIVIGYALSFGTLLFIIFFPYNDWHNAPGFYSEGYWPESVNVLFISFSRLLWSLALAWIVWACAVGYGGPLNWFLGHDWWVLGARLTYSAYLIHPMIIKVYWASITSPMHYSAFYMAVWYIATAVLAFSFACVVFLTVERPSMNLERLILPHRRS